MTGCALGAPVFGRIAQLVEQGIENPRVGGSTPSPATTALLLALALTGCGDSCEQLCTGVGNELASCKPASLSWNDLGARNRADFVDACQDQWNRSRIDLSASDLRLALEACDDTTAELQDLECTDIVALYAPAE